MEDAGSLSCVQDHGAYNGAHGLLLSGAEQDSVHLIRCGRLGALSSNEHWVSVRDQGRNFQSRMLVLIRPLHCRDYIAFNRGSPFHYLSSESVSAAKAKSGNKVEYILGHIIEIDECRAMGVEGGNPYALPIGTTYFVCTVTIL